LQALLCSCTPQSTPTRHGVAQRAHATANCGATPRPTLTTIGTDSAEVVARCALSPTASPSCGHTRGTPHTCSHACVAWRHCIKPHLLRLLRQPANERRHTN
jgi:hypothetical protein